MTRHAGVMLPLFSATSGRSWGIGEMADIAPLAVWLAAGGFDRLMILPIGVAAPGDTSPYGAQSTMAIDPMYLSLEDIVDFHRAGGLEALSPEAKEDRRLARAAPRIDYVRVKRAKREALALAFNHFLREEWEQLTTRAAALASFISRERWWLEDWSLYAAIAGTAGEPDWLKWPERFRDRQPHALAEVRRQLANEVLRHQYLQWQAADQWRGARLSAHAHGVTIFGDMPFMMSAASSDVWARRDEVMLDVSLGVPPDAFSQSGQDWGLPTYRWDRIAESGYEWIQQRARRMAALYDGYRVDHLVGLFRTYGKPLLGEAFFNPANENDQIRQGETILGILRESGASIIAEDLGVIPPFARASLERLGVPGCKVLRWERHWDHPDKPFINPATFPAMSAAMTGTHDTETLAEWWVSEGDGTPWSDGLRDHLLSAAYGSGSDELFVPMQDLFGWTDRINIPATVGDHNWTWRLPWRVDELFAQPAAVERAGFAKRMAETSSRSAPSPYL